MGPSRLSRVSFTCKYDFASLGDMNSNGSEQKGANLRFLQILAQIGGLEPSVDCKKVSGVVSEHSSGGSGRI